MPHPLIHDAAPTLKPQPGVEWADTMVLNPAIVRDSHGQRIHMLFRATGPGPRRERYTVSERDPYPIFLGYAWSDELVRHVRTFDAQGGRIESTANASEC